MRQCLSLVAFVILLVPAAALSREANPTPPLRMAPSDPPVEQSTGAREDTLFLFAASGPGSYGSPGTDARGFTFDFEGGPAAAGWFGVDLTAQEDTYWHLASTDICAGTGTDMSQAHPFDTMDLVNDYALWCGRKNICSWANQSGYGDDWRQYAVLDLTTYPVVTDLAIDFAYRSDFEGDTFDWFEVRVDSAGTWKTVHIDQTTGDRTFRELSINIPAADFGGGGTRVGFYFRSDSGWSDEDGQYDSNIGAVWIDNIMASVDGAQVFAADFEDGIEPAEISFETPPGAGLHAELRRTSFAEHGCIINSSYFWTFFDVGTTIPEYPIPVIPFGPPYVNEAVQSPWLEVDQHGNPIEIGPDTQVLVWYWMYGDEPPGTLVFGAEHPFVAARVDGICDGPFKKSGNTYWPEFSGEWYTWGGFVDQELQESADAAGGGAITGISIRLWVQDFCEVWCNQYGDGYPHNPAPFYDNVRVTLINRSVIDWNVDQFRRLQDNFAEDGGKVRMDCALDIQPSDSPTLVVGDSTTIDLNMDPLGGIKPVHAGGPGEVRPSLYMHFRVVEGPHAGSTDPAMGDPDASDGIWSPHIGTAFVNGETWNVALADSALSGGTWTSDRWAFDLADDWFEPGDVIEFYFRAEAVDGTVSVRPNWAESPDPDLRNYLRMRCLPTAGATVLFVEDRLGALPWWEEAFTMSGLEGHDIYSTQASSSGLNNGLGCRAAPGQLASYELIIWDCGNLPSGTLTNAPPSDLCYDTLLLEDWLNATPHDTGLWVMGTEVATDQTDAPGFLNTVLGVQRVASGTFYDDITGITIPRVLVTHPDLVYLDGTPHFILDGGCPSIENFDLVTPLGPFTEVTHEWEVDPGYGAVAGILNRDPDGDGTALSSTGHANRTLFNPFGYEHLLDEGYAVPAGRLYVRYMVKHVLEAFFGQNLYDVAADPVPTLTALNGAYPNPFNPSTRVDFSLASPGRVKLTIFDVAGRRVRTLLDERREAGHHEVEWQGRNDRGRALASGVYFLRFESEGATEREKLLLLK